MEPDMQNTDRKLEDDVLKRMLNTPPKPHKSAKESKAETKPAPKSGSDRASS